MTARRSQEVTVPKPEWDANMSLGQFLARRNRTVAGESNPALTLWYVGPENEPRRAAEVAA